MSLKNALLSIHLSFDLRTSPISKSILSLVGHYIDITGTACNALLALRDLAGSYTGINQGELVWLIIEQYHISTNLGYFTLDNAHKNYTSLEHIASKFRSVGSSHLFDIESKYVHCFSHVLNLVVHVFLYGKKSKALGMSQAMKDAIDADNHDIETWRKIGPLGKLRNIITWV